MAKINTRSPYFINVTDANITSCVLDLYIYTGTQVGTMDSITYSLETDVYNGIVSFEISQLISDYIESTFNGSFESRAVWVNYQLTKTINNVEQTPNSVIQLTAFDGYGYFEEGANPQLTNKVLQSNKKIYVNDNNYFYIPIQQDILSKVDLKLNNVIVATENFTPTSESIDIIRYIGYTNPSVCGSVNYLFEDRDNFLFQDSNNYIFSGVAEIDEMFITYSDASTESIYINTISEGKYKPYRLTFINKFGALQSVWMFKRTDISINIENETYRGYLQSGSSYSTSEHQYRNFNISSRQSISLSSGFYTEDYNEVFKQMMLSERVWIDYEGNILPVNIKSKELSFKTQLNDKLIDYKFEFEFAFDTINNVY